MFGTSRTPISAYRNVSIETNVASASPHGLVTLLFEGARQAILVARAGIEAGDVPRKGSAITRAIDIILNGLRASLDLEQGGNVAQNLYALYDYMARRLLHANLKNDTAALDEVLKLLSEIHEAWVSIGDKTNGASSS
ncbi:flagellar export chaperone FliS [Propionivibrio dicarboxylicus]|uniref:Flagellar secretion chaperone FliS n=1 Tax=Propionivibrio dicarboxylicus TaxID=83767 RepID=A0A1G8HBQ2_9RHOO|nr:flagellar export chaperone FliS [Propionivibrio dicarboxylicus]SDI04052.1 flagellar protein FliS [Propionivibrio dicarboxylicus]